MDRTAYKNRHIKEHYDRINLVIPKDKKDRIKNVCSKMGASVNEYLYMLVQETQVNGNLFLNLSGGYGIFLSLTVF